MVIVSNFSVLVLVAHQCMVSGELHVVVYLISKPFELKNTWNICGISFIHVREMKQFFIGCYGKNTPLTTTNAQLSIILIA